MSKKRITEVNITESLTDSDSFFINQNNTIKQVGLENFIYDNLDSTSSVMASSANQARVLNEKIEQVEEDVKVIIDEELQEINKDLERIEEAFRDGCNTIVAGCTTYGAQPESNSPEDIVEAIGEIYTNRYNAGIDYGATNINISTVKGTGAISASGETHNKTVTYTAGNSKETVLVFGVSFDHGAIKLDGVSVSCTSLVNKKILIDNLGSVDTEGLSFTDREGGVVAFAGLYVINPNSTITASITFGGNPGGGYMAIVNTAKASK